MTEYKRRDVLKMAGALGLVAATGTGLRAQTAVNQNLLDLYDRSIVIDALSFGRPWDELEIAALKACGYTGMVESLPRRNLQVAIDALVEWRERFLEFDHLIPALKAADFARAKKAGKTAVMMNFQNSTMLEGDVDNVDALHALGMRTVQLTYNYRNLVGDGCLERTNAGISEFGIEVVERMNKVGVMIDLSHCGEQTTLDGIEFSGKPVAITHSFCDAVRPNHPRGKTDEEIRNCAEKGGVFGVAALGYFLGPEPNGATTIETYADHIEHAAHIAGHDHIALSTDFSPRGIMAWATKETWYEPRLKSFKPSYQVKWPPNVDALDSTDRFRNTIAVLDRRGWTTMQLEKLLGANWVRMFENTIG